MKRLCNDNMPVKSADVTVQDDGRAAWAKVPHMSDLGKEQTKKEHMHLLTLHQIRGSWKTTPKQN